MQIRSVQPGRAPKNPNISNREVVLRPVDARFWETAHPIDYVIDLPVGLCLRILVPPGFITDLASVPRYLWGIWPPFGNYLAAAVIHDFLYADQAVNGMPVTRKDADQVFLLCMRDLGVGWFTRCALYRAVRAGGWWPWKNHITKRQQRL